MDPQRQRVLSVLLCLSTTPSVAVGQEAEVIRFREVLRVGEIGSAVEFGAIADVVIDDSGFVWVADRMAGGIVVLQPDLQPWDVRGREGGGPGEFRSIVKLSIVGDTIAALDPAQSRLSLISRTDRFVASVRVPPQSISSAHRIIRPPEAAFNDGSFLLLVASGAPGSDGRRLLLFRYEYSAQELNLLADLEIDQSSARLDVGGSVLMLRRPVNASGLHALLPGGAGIVVVDQSPVKSTAVPVTVARIGAKGDTVGRFHVRYEPRALAAEAARRELAPMAAAFASDFVARTSETREQLEERYFAALEIPAYQAPFDRLVVSSNGDVYLREGAFTLDRAIWRVFSPAEAETMRFSLPAEVDIMAVSDSRLFTRTSGVFEESILSIWERCTLGDRRCEP